MEGRRQHQRRMRQPPTKRLVRDAITSLPPTSTHPPASATRTCPCASSSSPGLSYFILLLSTRSPAGEGLVSPPPTHDILKILERVRRKKEKGLCFCSTFAPSIDTTFLLVPCCLIGDIYYTPFCFVEYVNSSFPSMMSSLNSCSLQC